MVDEMKELNLGIEEYVRPIYVTAMFTPKKAEEDFKLLSKYRDMFIGSYKGLDPKVLVHNLSIKKGFSLKKWPQQCFHPELILKICLLYTSPSPRD